MAHTINVDDLNRYRNMLLDQYNAELGRLKDRVWQAQQRFTIAHKPGAKTAPTSDHDAHGMSGICHELAKLAGQIEMIDAVVRSLTEVPK